MKPTQSPGDKLTNAESLADQEEDIVPQWLTERLQKMYAAIEGESLPKDFVILFRQLNEADHT